MALLATLLATVLFAAGGLYIQFKLAGFRNTVELQIEERLGLRSAWDSINVLGLRGVRINQLRASLDNNAGPKVQLAVPEVDIYLDIIELLYGQIAIDRIVIDQAHMVVERPDGAQWLQTKEADALLAPDGPLATIPFHITGKSCRLSVHNLVESAGVRVENIAFDLTRLQGMPEIFASLTGTIVDAPQQQVKIQTKYGNISDFDLSIQLSDLAATDIHTLFPKTEKFLSEGTISPTIRVTGYPHGTIIINLESTLQEVIFTNHALPRVSGALTALGQYDANTHKLTLTNANLTSDTLKSQIKGSVIFDGLPPRFDMRCEINQLPIDDLLASFSPEELKDNGDLTITMPDPYQVALIFQGTLDTPLFTVEMSGAGGQLDFAAKTPEWPSAQLEFGLMKILWDAQTGHPSGTVNVTGGQIQYPSYDLNADKVNGTLHLLPNKLELNPVQAQVLGQNFSGQATYLLDTRQMDFSVEGAVSGIEDTRFATAIKKTALSGDVSFTCSGSFIGRNGHVNLTGDFTQAQVDYDWWLRKPVGIGASLKQLTLTLQDKSTMTLEASATVDVSQLNATMNFTRAGKQWQIQRAAIRGDAIAIDSAGKCLRIPYQIKGGTGTGGVYTFERDKDNPAIKNMHFEGTFDNIILYPEGSEKTVSGQNIEVAVDFRSGTPEQEPGRMVVRGEQAVLPPFGEAWFRPFIPEDPELRAKFEAKRRPWTYDLQLKALEIPPWTGTQFTGTAYSNRTETGFANFMAQVGKGTVQGTYSKIKTSDQYHFSTHWDNIPATFLLRHLNMPELLAGTLSGDIDYSGVLNKPDTLKGRGKFTIKDGQFSADYVVHRFEEHFSDSLSALPPSLKFEELKSTVSFAGKKVSTPTITLKSAGIAAAGKGHFVMNGNMDYEIKLSLSPDVAERIPALKDNFSLKGYRLTQNTLDLTFHVTGPTFRPNGKVAGLPPVGMTLVSGAAEMTSDAIKVIDIPRQILIDLFKIGGGIVGATK